MSRSWKSPNHNLPGWAGYTPPHQKHHHKKKRRHHHTKLKSNRITEFKLPEAERTLTASDTHNSFLGTVTYWKRGDIWTTIGASPKLSWLLDFPPSQHKDQLLFRRIATKWLPPKPISRYCSLQTT